ncbi:MAG: TrmB family transcriptional regulator [Promethearchaeota archaeon]
MSSRVRDALKGLGITDYEISVYIALLHMGPSPASELSEESNVPLSKIYEVLRKLEEKGFIQVRKSDMQHKTKIYSALAPNEGVQFTLQNIERELKDFGQTVVDELTPVYEKSGEPEYHQVTLINGTANLLEKAFETLDNCKRQVLVTLPFITKELINLFEPAMQMLLKRGVNLRILISKSSLPLSDLGRLAKKTQVRVRDALFGGGIISDSREVLIILGEITGEDLQPTFGIWSEHVGLSRFAEEYFEFLWSSAESY